MSHSWDKESIRCDQYKQLEFFLGAGTVEGSIFCSAEVYAKERT